MFDLLRPPGRPHKTNQSAGSRAARGDELETTDAPVLMAAAASLSTDSTLTISPASTAPWQTLVETAKSQSRPLAGGLPILAGQVRLSPGASLNGVRGARGAESKSSSACSPAGYSCRAGAPRSAGTSGCHPLAGSTPGGGPAIRSRDLGLSGFRSGRRRAE